MRGGELAQSCSQVLDKASKINIRALACNITTLDIGHPPHSTVRNRQLTLCAGASRGASKLCKQLKLQQSIRGSDGRHSRQLGVKHVKACILHGNLRSGIFMAWSSSWRRDTPGSFQSLMHIPVTSIEVLKPEYTCNIYIYSHKHMPAAYTKRHARLIEHSDTTLHVWKGSTEHEGIKD